VKERRNGGRYDPKKGRKEGRVLSTERQKTPEVKEGKKDAKEGRKEVKEGK
jgi:hypothetical protein